MCFGHAQGNSVLSHPADLPASAEQHLLEGGESLLTPVDYGDVYVNVDDAWFAEAGIVPP